MSFSCCSKWWCSINCMTTCRLLCLSVSSQPWRGIVEEGERPVSQSSTTKEPGVQMFLWTPGIWWECFSNFHELNSDLDGKHLCYNDVRGQKKHDPTWLFFFPPQAPDVPEASLWSSTKEVRFDLSKLTFDPLDCHSKELADKPAVLQRITACDSDYISLWQIQYSWNIICDV